MDRGGYVVFIYHFIVDIFLKSSLGYLFLIIGVIGLFLPIIPGIPLISLGVTFISGAQKFLRDSYQKIKKILKK